MALGPVRPVIIPEEYPTDEEPEPRASPPFLGNLELELSFSLQPKSLNHPVVKVPLGFAKPFKMAVVVVTDEAAEVMTVGGAGNDRTDGPTEVPLEFEAMAQK